MGVCGTHDLCPRVSENRGESRTGGVQVSQLLALDVRGGSPIYHPFRWLQDGAMADNIYEFRPKPGDTEKITINLGYVDLGHIDLLVQEGFYSNRTDFIRT